ncbi:lanthionine synthetase C family protein [Streptomyces sp. NBC_00289]|uniref:lanthionine synthetase C family protein n=1 Tax=Streptomyces sp. NBC_00289 TaxID=2975703 RepID=UPI0032550DC5
MAWHSIIDEFGNVGSAVSHPTVVALEGLVGPFRDGSLATGDAGVALAHAYASCAGKACPSAVPLIESSWSRSVTSGAAPTSLYCGVTGVAWVTAHLNGLLFDLADEDVLDSVDLALLAFLSGESMPREYDLVSGLVGLGVYVLQRLPRPTAVTCLERIVDHLAMAAVYREEGAAWFTGPEALPERNRQLAPHGYYNMGVAHGVPGVVWLLAHAARAGVRSETASALADAAVHWILSQRRPLGGDGGLPSFVGPSGEAGEARPFAWCYGAPGVAGVLFAAARVFGHAEWEEAAVEMALSAVHLRPEATSVSEAGICHGAAGLGHVFNRLYQSTGEKVLADAARRWINRAVELLPSNTGAGFLEGRAGVALVMLAALEGTEPAWDRVLLLS